MSNWNKSQEEREKEDKIKSDVMDKYPLLFRNYRRPSPHHLMNYGLSVGMGWIPLIDEMASKIEKIIQDNLKQDPNFKYPTAVQVKEKFATLRFYVDRSHKEIDKIIEEYEVKSGSTCEECGSNGTIRRKGWMRTLCDSCDQKRQ